MSGVWESLFREEKQDLTTSSIVVSLADLMMEIPCIMLASVSAAFALVWEFIVAQAHAVSEIVHLDEWWGIEHTIFVTFITVLLVCLLRRGRGDWFSLLCQTNCNLQTLATFGCFLWMAAAFQGGVIFGGKLVLPTLALFSLAFQMARVIQYNAEKETHGYGVRQVAQEGPGAKVQKYFGRFVCLETSLFFSLATFGVPKLGNTEDLVPLLTIFPAAAMIQQLFDYFQPEVAVAAVAPAQTDITDNGNATKMAEEKEAVAAVQEAEEKPVAEEPVAAVQEEEEKPVEETAEVEPTPDSNEPVKKEDKAQPEEPAKLSAVCLVKAAAVKLVCQSSALVKAAVTKVKDVTVDAAEKILSLPWSYILYMTSSIGTVLALTYAYWSLTEDWAVLIIPALCHLLPMAAEKAQTKNWISERGYLAVIELSGLGAAATQYYLFRSNISLPF